MILEFILKLGKCRVINRGPGPLCMYYVLSVLLPDLFHGNFHPAHATPSQCPSLLREQQVCVRRFSLPFCVLECFYPHSSFAQVWAWRTDLFPVSSRPLAPPRALCPIARENDAKGLARCATAGARPRERAALSPPGPKKL